MSINSYDFEYDASGTSPANLVEDYPIRLDRTGERAFSLIGPFFQKGLKFVSELDPDVELVEGRDYRLLYIHDELFDIVDSPVFSIVHFYNQDIVGNFLARIQVLGGNRQGNASIIKQMIENIKSDSSDVYLENIIDFPTVLPPEGHLHVISDTYGYENAMDILGNILTYLKSADKDLGLTISGQINAINGKYNTLLELIDGLGSDIGDSSDLLTQRLNELVADFEDLTERVVALEQNLANYKNTVDQRFRTNESNFNSLNNQFSQFKGSVTQWQQQMTQSLQQQNQTISNLNDEVGELKQKQLQSEQSIRNNRDDITELQESQQQQDLLLSEISDNIGGVESQGPTACKIMRSASTMDSKICRHLALSNGPFKLPKMTGLKDGHTHIINSNSNYHPVVNVNQTGSERINYNGNLDTSIKIEDIFEMKFIKISATVWALVI